MNLLKNQSWMVGIGTVLGLIALPGVSFAGDQGAGQAVIADYVSIQEALATDSLDSAKSAATKLEKSAKTSDLPKKAEITRAAALISQAKSLADARKAFKQLSGPIVDWAEKNKPEDVQVSYCAMAGAKWVQKKGEIQNPYYGKEMQSCGEKVSG